MESIIDRIGGEDRSQHLVNHFHDLIESLPQGRTIMEMHQKGDAPGGVFNQLSQAIAHASATRPVKEVMVFSQRRAMRRKRWIWWMNRSTRLRKLQSAQSMALVWLRDGFCLICAVAPRSLAMKMRR